VPWEDEEIRRLKSHVEEGMDMKSIAAEFAGRSQSSIKGKIDRLGLALRCRSNDVSEHSIFKILWTEEDILQLKKCVENDADLNTIVMKFPQRHPAAVVVKLANLGLEYRRTRNEPRIKHDKRVRWTEEEDETLLAYIDNHHTKSKSVRANLDIASLATRLRRTPMGVMNRMRRLRQKSTSAPDARKYWSEEDLRLTSQWRAEGVKVKVIGERLGRSELSIENQLKVMRKTKDRPSD